VTRLDHEPRPPNGVHRPPRQALAQAREESGAGREAVGPVRVGGGAEEGAGVTLTEMVEMWRKGKARELRTHATKVAKAYTKGELAQRCQEYAADLRRAADIVEGKGGDRGLREAGG